MPLPVPQLDDRKFQDLVDEAKRRIPRLCPTWTDHNVSDPGIALIELFAWMTEQYLYRLNQVPDRNLITFLNLMGMQLEPARPARGDVTFALAAAPAPDRRVIIPAWTEVATERTDATEATVFTTDREAEVVAPTLRWLLTAENGEQYDDRTRALREGAGVDVWKTPPATPQAFFLGFDQDLSAHTLAIAVRCAKVAIGIDPSRPPWAWRVWRGSEFKWEPVRVLSDETAGLNQDGELRLELPYSCQPHRLPPYEARTVLRCTPQENLAPGETPYAQSPRIYAVAPYTIGITVPVTHAQPVGPAILGISSGQPRQVLALQDRNILKPEGPEEVVEVENERGEWEAWGEVSDFGDSRGPDHKHYMLDPISGQVEFGPAIRQRDGTEPQFGAIPPRGSTVRMRRYRVGGGVRGNVAEGKVTVLKSTLPYIAGVINRAPITGGEESQSLDDAKLRAPARLRTRYRAVTEDDFEYLAQQVEGVGRVRCLQPRPDDSQAPRPGTVQLLIIPNRPALNGPELDRHIDLHELLTRQQERAQTESQLRAELELPEGTLARLREYLDDRRLLTTRVEVGPPQYVWVTVQTRIRAHPKAEPERVRREVKVALYRFLHPLFGGPDHQGWPFGQALTIDKVYALIQSIPGVEYATELNLYPIDIDHPQGQRLGKNAQVVPVPANGVIVSYYHNVYLAS